MANKFDIPQRKYLGKINPLDGILTLNIEIVSDKIGKFKCNGSNFSQLLLIYCLLQYLTYY